MITTPAKTAQLQKLQDWLREPDHAEHFGTPQILEWINRRPTHIVPAVLASLPRKSGEGTDVERMAKALGLHRFPGGKSANNPPTRWPSGANDILSGRDGTVPLTWEFAETCRAEVRAMLAALNSDATLPDPKTGEN